MRKRLARALLLGGILAFGRSIYELDHLVISDDPKSKRKLYRKKGID